MRNLEMRFDQKKLAFNLINYIFGLKFYLLQRITFFHERSIFTILNFNHLNLKI